jgi:hypothetical protein
MARYRSGNERDLPPTLRRLIQAIRDTGKDAAGRDISGAAESLREFGRIAQRLLPVYGVFGHADDALDVLLDRVASEHLGLARARREFRHALRLVEEFEHRNAIEMAHGHVQAISDDARLYAGIAFGVCLSESVRYPG